MRKASTKLLKQGTQTPSPAPDLIPAETNHQPRTHIGIGTANGGTSVLLHFTVNEQGDTSEIEAVRGHELLQHAATDNLQNWKFGWPHPCACRVKKEAIFIYKLSGELESAARPIVMVKWFGKIGVVRVEIQSDLVQFQTETAR